MVGRQISWMKMGVGRRKRNGRRLRRLRVESTSHARTNQQMKHDLNFFDQISKARTLASPRRQNLGLFIVAFPACFLPINLTSWTLSIPAPSPTYSDTATTTVATRSTNGLTLLGPALPFTLNPYYGSSGLVLPGPGPVTASTTSHPFS